MRANDDRSLFFWVNCRSISGENMMQVCSHLCWQLAKYRTLSGPLLYKSHVGHVVSCICWITYLSDRIENLMSTCL